MNQIIAVVIGSDGQELGYFTNICPTKSDLMSFLCKGIAISVPFAVLGSKLMNE